jgi:FkbM family methyltransferase
MSAYASLVRIQRSRRIAYSAAADLAASDLIQSETDMRQRTIRRGLRRLLEQRYGLVMGQVTEQLVLQIARESEKVTTDVTRRSAWLPAAETITAHLGALIRAYRVNCVLDVGANIGQYVDMLRYDVGYHGDVISFEPASGPYRELHRAARHDARWRTVRLALGHEATASNLNIYADSQFNSLYNPTVLGLRQFSKHLQHVATERVHVERLDNVVRPLTQAQSMLLKIDTQGHELAVLEGAYESLQRIAVVQLEVPVLQIYDGTTQLRDVLARFDDLGLAVSGIFPIKRDAALQLIEIDIIAVRER